MRLLVDTMVAHHQKADWESWVADGGSGSNPFRYVFNKKG